MNKMCSNAFQPEKRGIGEAMKGSFGKRLMCFFLL